MGCCSSTDQTYSVPTATIDTPMPQTPKGIHLVKKFELLIKNKEYSKVIKMCRKQVQNNINQQMEIDGMGNSDQAISYYQWNKFEWYADGISKGEYIGTVYDLLSLCELELRYDEDEIDQAKEWYRRMIDSYPQKYQILYGYANVLYSKAIYQEAIDFYNRAIQIKPNWKMPYECLAFTYQYRRIQLKKANELAEKLLKMQPNNRVGMYILARNEIEVDLKIQKLIEASQFHPRYVRLINQIGIAYGAKKEHREAIVWYKKCNQIAPQYSACCNNVGVRLELLKQQNEAMSWYFKAIERDKQYKAPLNNLIDCFNTLKFTDQQINAQMAKYKIQTDYFYYYLGLAYYDRKNNETSLKYYFLAEQNANLLKKSLFQLYNSIGITYDEMKKQTEAIKYYTKCIQINPKYHMAYYNAAYTYKNLKKVPEAIEWYKKAIQVNHRYHRPYNNLGNIYKDQQKYEDAVKCYKQAVKYHSTYTLGYANLGICYLKLQKYREAFNAISRASQLLPTDNNNLSQGNKSFLADTLKQFEKQGQTWRQSGGITADQKQKLSQLVKSFQANFKTLYQQNGAQVSRQKVLRREITQIIKLIGQDRFQLKNIDRIYDLVKSAFQDNEDYFHIIPQVFLQYFMNNTFKDQIPVLQTENYLREIVKRFSAKTAADQSQSAGNVEDSTIKDKYEFKLKHFNPPSQCKVNLFQNSKYFQNYQELYAEIMEVNNVALAAYQPFKSLVDQVRKQSYGIPYGVGMKIPKKEQDQFKVILRIYQKMFKKEINSESVKQIITKIEQQIKKKTQKQEEIGFTNIVLDIMDVWTEYITGIVKNRRQQKIQTVCQISDLLRGKVMFETVDRLRKALQITEQLCFQNGYQIIEMDNRLAKPQTQDVVLKIKVQGAICEFQLAMEQEENQYHFVHSIYEIERSPLGCIFGSYIYLSKGVNYHIVQNCKDILTLLAKEKGEDTIELEEAAKYLVETIKLN